MIFTIDGSSFLMEFDEQNTSCIQKYCGQNLACWCFHLWSLWTLSPATVQSADCWFDLGVQRWIHVSSLHNNSFLLFWKSWKQCSESSMFCCFWSTVSKCCTCFEHSFLIDKYSCKIVNTLPSDIFNSFALSNKFNLRLSKISFLVFSWTTAEFRLPEHSASFVCTTAFIWLVSEF